MKPLGTIAQRRRVVPCPYPCRAPLNRNWRRITAVCTKKSSGAGIRSSREIQEMNRADNMAQTRQGQTRMNGASDGNTDDVSLQYRNIQGRAVYQNADLSWTDSEVAKQNNAKTKRVQFASDAYFDLANNAKAQGFLALGNNVNFCIGWCCL